MMIETVPISDYESLYGVASARLDEICRLNAWLEFIGQDGKRMADYVERIKSGEPAPALKGKGSGMMLNRA